MKVWLRRESRDCGNVTEVVAQYEGDLHADSVRAAGPHFHCDEYTGKNCDTTPSSTGYEPLKSGSIRNASIQCVDCL